MNGIHDLGGMHGFGPVEIEPDEPVFHEEWEGRVLGMLSQLRALPLPPRPGGWRAIIEGVAPMRYLAASDYERFLEVVETRAREAGLITEAELNERIAQYRTNPDQPVPRREDLAAVERMRVGFRTQPRPEPAGAPPRFQVGDAVVARNLHPAGHTRLPRYIRGKRGVVVRVNGWYAIQDADPTGLGPSPQTVYTVRFDGREVWGPNAEPNTSVALELWEGYLEPADAAADENERREP